MAAPDITNTWENIRQGVKDAELLIGQKKYNLSMMKCRQVLEVMVDYLCIAASIPEDNLAASIDVLYDSQWISKTTCEHYHKIRILGNKAAHEGNDEAYDANQAYHLLSKEVYTFANEYKKKGRQGGSSAGRPGPRSSGSQGGRSPAGRSSASRNTGSRNSRPSSRNQSSSRSRKRQSSAGFSISPTDIVRIALVIVAVVVIVILVRIFSPSKPDTPETQPTSATTPAVLPTQETIAPTTVAPTVIETMAPTTAPPVYKTNDALNVRSEPSTAGQKLGTLENGTIVDFVEDYDDEWAIINYNGSQAYVNKQYLTKD